MNAAAEPSFWGLMLAPLLGLVLSIAGTLPLGIINLSVARVRLRRGMAAALRVALGAALAEGLQVFVSLVFARQLASCGEARPLLAWAPVAVLGGMGLYLLLAPPPVAEGKSAARASDFWLGALLSMLNLMAYPYWMFYGIWLQSRGWLGSEAPGLLLFTLGAVAGTWLTLYAFARLAGQILKCRARFALLTQRLIALLFLLLGLWQALELLTPASLHSALRLRSAASFGPERPASALLSGLRPHLSAALHNPGAAFRE